MQELFRSCSFLILRLCSLYHQNCICVNPFPTRTLTIKTATFADDEVLLGRVVPYLVALLSDPAALVRARSLRALTAVTARVRSLPVGEANLFPEYIFPAIERLPIDPEEVVRLAHAQCIARLAQNSKRFLEMAQYQARRGQSAGNHEPPKTINVAQYRQFSTT
jgi:hypothetical protein